MAWTNSKVFRQTLADILNNDTAFDLSADGFKNALYNNSVTPDNDVTAANTAYNVGQWATANEVFEAGQWAQAGVALAGTSVNVGTADVVFFDANDTASGSAADLANVFGCHIYNTTVSTPVDDQGLAYLYLGGSNSVVNGTLTVAYSASGIVRATL